MMAARVATLQAGATGIQRAGGFAASYIAAGYLAAIPYVAFLVDYPGATGAEDKVTLFARHHTSM
jgi:hypothetical protein